MKEPTWTLTKHACGSCFARLLARTDDAGVRVYRCSNCANTGYGKVNGHPANCACGLKVGSQDMGMRCVVNPNPRPEMLSEIIVQEVR